MESVQHHTQIEARHEQMYKMPQSDLDVVQLGEFGQYLDYIINKRRKLGRTDLIMAAYFFHQRGKRKGIADGEGVGIKCAIPWMVSIHLVAAHRYELNLVRNAKFGLKFCQMLGR